MILYDKGKKQINNEKSASKSSFYEFFPFYLGCFIPVIRCVNVRESNTIKTLSFQKNTGPSHRLKIEYYLDWKQGKRK
jgi:hypothetical protein